MRVTDKYVFFWGSEFSNWYKTKFTYWNKEFTSSEQAIMWAKAHLFNDEEVANKILETDDPKTQKALGRKVRNFDVDVWNQNAPGIVTYICYYKFSQNEYLKNLILSYGNREFVEASPHDKIWGIGLHYEDDDVLDKSKWQGKNWLGIALTNVRDKLVMENNND